jgi:hypothetical protein
VIERVRITEKDIVIEGRFGLPELPGESGGQIFLDRSKRWNRFSESATRRSKSRLNRIAKSLEFVDTDPAPSRAEVLDRLEPGEISAHDAIRELEALQ